MSEFSAELRRSTREFVNGPAFQGYFRDAQANPKLYPHEFIRHAANFGYTGMEIPEEFGGFKLDAVDQAAVIEEINRGSSGFGLTVIIQNSLAAYPIVRWGSQAQKEKYLPGMAEGRIIGCYGLTEPEFGSDAKGVETRAEFDGDAKSFVINGTKRFISSASDADLMILIARTGSKQEREKGLTAFIADLKKPEVTVTKFSKLGMPGSVLCEVYLNDLVVPEGNLLSGVGDGTGWDVAEGTLKHSRIQIGSQGVGIAQSALDIVEDYADIRRAFGRSSLKEIPHYMSHLNILRRQVDLSRFLVEKAARHEDAGDKDFFVWASLAKLVAGETAIKVASDGMLLLGGIGYIDGEMRAGQIYKDAAVVRIYEGAAHIQSKIIEHYLDPGSYRQIGILDYPTGAERRGRFQELMPLEEVKRKVEKWKVKKF